MKYGICHHRDGVLIEEIPEPEAERLGIGYTLDELLEKLRYELDDIERSIDARNRKVA